MTDVVRLALRLTADSGAVGDLVKKHKFQGHALDVVEVLKLVVKIIATCKQITEAIDDSPKP